MSDPTSIFTQTDSGLPADTTNTSGNGVTAQTDSELADLLGSIKNERGEVKYKSVKEAIIGLQNAQDYIPQLKQSLTERETELTALRAETKRVADLEDTVRQLTERQDNSGTPPRGLNEQDIADLINKSLDTTLSKREQLAAQKANVDSVVDTLKASFGAEAAGVLRFRAPARQTGRPDREAGENIRGRRRQFRCRVRRHGRQVRRGRILPQQFPEERRAGSGHDVPQPRQRSGRGTHRHAALRASHR